MSSPSHTVVLSALSGLVVAQDCPVLFFEGLEFAYQRVHRRIHSVTEEIHRPSVVYSHATVYELAGFPLFPAKMILQSFSCLLPDLVSFFSYEHKVMDMSFVCCYSDRVITPCVLSVLTMSGSINILFFVRTF